MVSEHTFDDTGVSLLCSGSQSSEQFATPAGRELRDLLCLLQDADHVGRDHLVGLEADYIPTRSWPCQCIRIGCALARTGCPERIWYLSSLRRVDELPPVILRYPGVCRLAWPARGV